MKVGFIINSLLSSEKELSELFDPFKSNVLFFSYHATQFAGHSIELAKKLKAESYDWIISAGGDGTLNEIINGLIDEVKSADELPTLAMFPVGTGNDYSLSIKTTRDPEKFTKALIEKSTQKIDIGKIVNEEGKLRYFINVADAGMGGEVTQKIATSGNRIGKWVYYKTILQSLFTYKRPTLFVSSKEWSGTQKVITVVIGKGISFGGGYKIVFNAKLNDGNFFVAVVGDISILTYLLKIPSLMKGKKIDHPLVKYFSTKELKLENKSDFPCFLEMDGEPAFHCPVTISCLAQMLNFMHLEQ